MPLDTSCGWWDAWGQGPGNFTTILDLLVGLGDTLYVLRPRGLAVFDSVGVLA